MKKKLLTLMILTAVVMFKHNFSNAKESVDYTCYKRGVEIIYPYENAIFKIKKIFDNYPDKKKKELVKFKQKFEKNFYGIPLYKEAGCSNARLSEYLECLISTDGKNCKIYYTQMRIVD
tara:strand:+ start:50 stop:406 length:357 start_codon:yes stop_codon:yes gene_type:complete